MEPVSPPRAAAGAGEASAKSAIAAVLLGPCRVAVPGALPGALVVGALRDGCNAGRVARHGITHVVNASNTEYELLPGVEARLDVQVRDMAHESLLLYVEQVAGFVHSCLEREGAVCLVHCMMGRSRGVAFAMAYLMLRHNLAFDAAFAAVAKTRTCARLNSGFVVQLRLLERFGTPARAQQGLMQVLRSKVWQCVMSGADPSPSLHPDPLTQPVHRIKLAVRREEGQDHERIGVASSLCRDVYNCVACDRPLVGGESELAEEALPEPLADGYGAFFATAWMLDALSPPDPNGAPLRCPGCRAPLGSVVAANGQIYATLCLDRAVRGTRVV